MRVLVIRNPEAGRGRAARAWPDVAQRLRGAGVEFEQVDSARPLDAIEIAERAAGRFDCVAAAGGDGTVHEVVNGLMRAGAKAALGVIPLGSGDDFAKLLSHDFVSGFLAGKTSCFDVGRIVCGGETRYFANGMDIGFGAHGAANVARIPGFLTGIGAYLGALALTMLRYPLLQLRIQIDDAPAFDFRTAMTAAMNGTTFGGSFRVCPSARPDDGLLDLLLVEGVGRLGILQLVPKILKGSHAGDRRLRMVRARRLLVESSEPLLVEADGELVFQGASRLAVDLLPGALRVFA